VVLHADVIPVMWLPLTALLPWLIPRWWRSLREHDLRSALLLVWIVTVVMFFTFSEGKRGIYVLPAVPALALACAPWLNDIAHRRRAQQDDVRRDVFRCGDLRRCRNCSRAERARAGAVQGDLRSESACADRAVAGSRSVRRARLQHRASGARFRSLWRDDRWRACWSSASGSIPWQTTNGRVRASCVTCRR
jgi:hypothetical protein